MISSGSFSFLSFYPYLICNKIKRLFSIQGSVLDTFTLAIRVNRIVKIGILEQLGLIKLFD